MRLTFKLIRFIKKYDLLKTTYWTIKLKVSKNNFFRVCPNSIIDVTYPSDLEVVSAMGGVNDSFEETRNRKYKSELRIRPQGKLRLLGKIKLYNGASIFVSNNAMLTIGDNTFINTNSNVICFNEIN